MSKALELLNDIVEFTPTDFTGNITMKNVDAENVSINDASCQKLTVNELNVSNVNDNTLQEISQSGKPNVMILLLDDTCFDRWPESGNPALAGKFTGKLYDEKIELQGFKEFMNDGAVAYTNFYTGSSCCQPAQMALMSGMHVPSIAGQYQFVQTAAFPYFVKPDSDMMFLSELFKQKLNYWCTSIGKLDYGVSTTLDAGNHYQAPLLNGDCTEPKHMNQIAEPAEGRPFFTFFNFMDNHEFNSKGTRDFIPITDPLTGETQQGKFALNRRSYVWENVKPIEASSTWEELVKPTDTFLTITLPDGTPFNIPNFFGFERMELKDANGNNVTDNNGDPVYKEGLYRYKGRWDQAQSHVAKESLGNLVDYVGDFPWEQLKKEDLTLSHQFADDDRVRMLLSREYDAIRQSDLRLQVLIKWMKEKGYYDNTHIILFGDHGSGTFTGKRSLTESSIHSPAWIKFAKNYEPSTYLNSLATFASDPNTPANHPYKAESFKVDHQFFNIHDIFPTVAGLVDIEIPHKTDGRNIVSTSDTSEAYAHINRFMSTIYHKRNGVRTDKYYYTKNYMLDWTEDTTSQNEAAKGFDHPQQIIHRIIALEGKMIGAPNNKAGYINKQTLPVDTGVSNDPYYFTDPRTNTRRLRNDIDLLVWYNETQKTHGEALFDIKNDPYCTTNLLHDYTWSPTFGINKENGMELYPPGIAVQDTEKYDLNMTVVPKILSTELQNDLNMMRQKEQTWITTLRYYGSLNPGWKQDTDAYMAKYMTTIEEAYLAYGFSWVYNHFRDVSTNNEIAYDDVSTTTGTYNWSGDPAGILQGVRDANGKILGTSWEGFWPNAKQPSTANPVFHPSGGSSPSETILFDPNSEMFVTVNNKKGHIVEITNDTEGALTELVQLKESEFKALFDNDSYEYASSTVADWDFTNPGFEPQEFYSWRTKRTHYGYLWHPEVGRRPVIQYSVFLFGAELMFINTDKTYLEFGHYGTLNRTSLIDGLLQDDWFVTCAFDTRDALWNGNSNGPFGGYQKVINGVSYQVNALGEWVNIDGSANGPKLLLWDSNNMTWIREAIIEYRFGDKRLEPSSKLLAENGALMASDGTTPLPLAPFYWCHSDIVNGVRVDTNNIYLNQYSHFGGNGHLGCRITNIHMSNQSYNKAANGSNRKGTWSFQATDFWLQYESTLTIEYSPFNKGALQFEAGNTTLITEDENKESKVLISQAIRKGNTNGYTENFYNFYNTKEIRYGANTYYKN